MTLNLLVSCSSRALLKDGLQANTASTVYVSLECKPLVSDPVLQFQSATRDRKKSLGYELKLTRQFHTHQIQIVTFFPLEGGVTFDSLVVLKLFFVDLESFGLSWLCLNMEGL